MREKLLKKGDVIWLSVERNGGTPERFTIERCVGEGSSAACYYAMRQRDRKWGKLKEFYPMEADAGEGVSGCSLARLDNGQLVPDGDTAEAFYALCREYVSSFDLLRQKMEQPGANEVLINYIQDSDVLYGVGEESEAGRSGTVYIWSPGLAGRGFDAYLREVREKPGEDPQGYICGVLQAVGALTHCVKALHAAGLLHLDIKPDNFMIPCDSDLKDNTRAISLFDTNTLYDVSAGSAPRTAGTPGFRAPELRAGTASASSDIYSIGAVLFYALVITDEIPDGRYQDKYYPDIGRLLKDSVLMQEAAKTGGEDMPRLLGCLEGILNVCLAAESWKRYDGCSPLLEALQRAESIASGLGSGRREAADESGDGAEIVMQKLLYDHPLYSAIDPSSGKISVLVLGSEDNTRKFIDAALQAGQMKGYALSVTVLSDAPEEARNTYLEPRPDLTRFVRVEGVPDRVPGGQTYEAYARLRFRRVADPDNGTESTAFFGQDGAQNEKLAGYIVAERLEEQDRFYDYTFISLGDSALNRSVAERLVQKLGDWTGNVPQCPIC